MNPYKTLPNCDSCKVNAAVFAMIPSGRSLCPACAKVDEVETKLESLKAALEELLTTWSTQTPKPPRASIIFIQKLLKARSLLEKLK